MFPLQIFAISANIFFRPPKADIQIVNYFFILCLFFVALGKAWLWPSSGTPYGIASLSRKLMMRAGLNLREHASFKTYFEELARPVQFRPAPIL
jgi:hypothetical protein